jgi:hypothetical protein
MAQAHAASLRKLKAAVASQSARSEEQGARRGKGRREEVKATRAAAPAGSSAASPRKETPRAKWDAEAARAHVSLLRSLFVTIRALYAPSTTTAAGCSLITAGAGSDNSPSSSSFGQPGGVERGVAAAAEEEKEEKEEEGKKGKKTSKRSSKTKGPGLAPTHQAALAVIPPTQLWGGIQAIRADNDKSFQRWPPHFNCIYP